MIAATVLTALIVGGSLLKDVREIGMGGNFSNVSNIEAHARLKKLNVAFPNQKFSVYSYKYKWADKNLILSLYLNVGNKIGDSGRRIGIVVATKSGEFKYPIILGDKEGYQLLDLQSSSSSQLSQGDWVRVNPRDIYLSTEEWYSKK